MRLIAERTFNLLKGFGYDVSSFNKEGDLVIDPMEATRFAVESPNILVRLDPTEKYLSLKTGNPGESIEKLRPMLKELAQDYLLDFDYSVFDKQIRPKGEKIDVAKKSQEEFNMSEDISILKQLAGLQENPKFLQKPPGADYKFGQDKNQKLSFSTNDIQDLRDFYAKVLVLNDPDLDSDKNPMADKILLKAYDLYKLNKEDPKSAVVQAKQALKITGNQADDQMVGLPYENKNDNEMNYFNKFAKMLNHDGKPLPAGVKEVPQGKGGRLEDGDIFIAITTDNKPLDWPTYVKWEQSYGETDMNKISLRWEQYTYDAHDFLGIPRPGLFDNINEASLGKMTGSRKSSYQPLADSVKIIVRHNKEVNEEVRGARSRNIHSILIQRGEEKFKMAENNLSAARAMARHLHNGGETFDVIGEAITEMSREFKKLKEFIGYVKKAKLVNETNEEFVSMALENIDTIRTNFKRLSGVKSYANAVESVTAYNNVELLQDDIDLESKFTETHFDDKVANVMDTLKASASRKHSFESKIIKAIESESFEGITDLLKEDDLLEFESLNQQLGHQVSRLGYSAKDETLGNYLHSISGKLNAGGQLNQFEYGAIKSCLLSAGQHNVGNSAPMTATESYEAFLDRFDI